MMRSSSDFTGIKIHDLPLPRDGGLCLLINVFYEKRNDNGEEFLALAKKLVKQHLKKKHSLYSVVYWYKLEGTNGRKRWVYSEGVLRGIEEESPFVFDVNQEES